MPVLTAPPIDPGTPVPDPFTPVEPDQPPMPEPLEPDQPVPPPEPEPQPGGVPGE